MTVPNRSRKLVVGLLLAVSFLSLILACVWLASDRPASVIQIPTRAEAVAVSQPAPPHPMGNWDELGELLPAFRGHPAIGALVRDAESRLRDYRTLCEREFAAITSAVQLDCVLNAHPGPVTRDVDLVARSQSQVRQTLDAGEYLLIGLEGSHGDTMTIEGVYRELVAEMLALDPEADLAAFRRNFDQEMVPDHAPLEYLNRRQSARGVGIEVRPLRVLHGRLIACIRSGEIPFTALVTQLHGRLSDARTDIAVARMMSAMRRQHVSKAAFAIGLGHQARIAYVYETYGINGRIIEAE